MTLGSSQQDTRPRRTLDVAVFIPSTLVFPSDIGASMQPGLRGWSYLDMHKVAFIETLERRAFSVRIIAMSSGACQCEKIPGGDIWRVPIRLPLSKLAFLSSQARLLLSFLASSAKVLYLYHDGDSLALLSALPSLFLTRRPHVLDLRNPPRSMLPDKTKNYLTLLRRVLDKALVSQSELVVVITNTCAQLVQNRFPQLRVLVVGSVPTFAITQPKRISSGSGKGMIRFCYWGSLGKKRELGIFLQAFLQEHSSVKVQRELMFIGAGDGLESLVELAKTRPEAPVKFLPWMGQRELASFLEEVDVCIVPIPPTIPEYYYASPIKMFEALSLRIPVIVTRISSATLVEQARLGIVCDHSIEGYRAALRSMTKETLESMRKQIDQALEQGKLVMGDKEFDAVIERMRDLVTQGS